MRKIEIEARVKTMKFTLEGSDTDLRLFDRELHKLEETLTDFEWDDYPILGALYNALPWG